MYDELVRRKKGRRQIMRLTYRDSTVPHTNAKGELWEAYSDANYNEIINKLAAYEDAEEQGRLVILPCKVGDTLYAPTRSFVAEFRVTQFDFGGYEKPYLWVEWNLTKGITDNFRVDGIGASEIGKTVFLTRAEAEAAMDGGSDDVSM